MPYAVEWSFDPGDEQRVAAVFESLGPGRGDGRPHVTVAVFEMVDLAVLSRRLEEVARGAGAFELTWTGPGVLLVGQPTPFLSAETSESLNAIQQAWHAGLFKIGVAAGAWTAYRPGNWRPRCTMVRGLEDLSLSRPTAAAAGLPLTVTVRRASIVRFEPAEVLANCEIGGD